MEEKIDEKIQKMSTKNKLDAKWKKKKYEKSHYTSNHPKNKFFDMTVVDFAHIYLQVG